MDMVITLPGGARVDAQFDGFTVKTDQPLSAGGAGAAPTPFALFLAAIGTCAGIYVLGFCQQRNIPTTGIRIVQQVHTDPETGLADQIDLDIQLPVDFPEKYRTSIIKAAELCKVKKHLETPPKFRVFTTTAEALSV